MDHFLYSSGNIPNAAQGTSAFLAARSGFVSWPTRTSGDFSAKLLSNQVVPSHLGAQECSFPGAEFGTSGGSEMSPFLHCGVCGWQLGLPVVPATSPCFVSSAQSWIILYFSLCRNLNTSAIFRNFSSHNLKLEV